MVIHCSIVDGLGTTSFPLARDRFHPSDGSSNRHHAAIGMSKVIHKLDGMPNRSNHSQTDVLEANASMYLEPTNAIQHACILALQGPTTRPGAQPVETEIPKSSVNYLKHHRPGGKKSGLVSKESSRPSFTDILSASRNQPTKQSDPSTPCPSFSLTSILLHLRACVPVLSFCVGGDGQDKGLAGSKPNHITYKYTAGASANFITAFDKPPDGPQGKQS